MTTPIIELFSVSTLRDDVDWQGLLAAQPCPYLDRKCVKVRKSQPDISIGTCVVQHGVQLPRNVIVCPHRFLERGQIFSGLPAFVDTSRAGERTASGIRN